MTHNPPIAKETEVLIESMRRFIQQRRANKVFLSGFCWAFKLTERQFYRWPLSYRPPFVKRRGRWELTVPDLRRWLEEQEREPGVQ